ncbi:hypothetical protein NDU88_002534 [Pleurodeles waltl]|uniref:Uncharacterized protein n=1 Tax=Pleurodeles waltl TaxID=8319 RepID=A0AAV7MBA2_PLEWA|nr:hypothetical protein NDU88_002534 [Pleurodeles waltl]
MPPKAWRKHCTEEQILTIGDTGKNNTTMEPELQVFPMLIYVMLHLEHQRRRQRVGEDTEDACMDIVEVSASEVCVLLGVVMLVVDVDAVHAGLSVDEIVREVEEEEEEGETVEAVDVVVSATVWCLCECLCLTVPLLGVVMCACLSVCVHGMGWG